MKNTSKEQNSRINITDSVATAARNRLSIVVDALDGRARLRGSRWPGKTSLYDSHRMVSLIEDLAYGSSVTGSRIINLMDEVPTYRAVLGPQLNSALNALLTETGW